MGEKTKNKIKNVLIIVLIVLIGLFGLFGGKRVIRYQKELALLKYDNTGLNIQIIKRDNEIKFEQQKLKDRDRKIDSMNKMFMVKDNQIIGLNAKLDSALVHLEGITSDSSYIFLQRVAYNFPGTMKYLFNALQIHGIHADYLIPRSLEKTTPIYKEQILNCKIQFMVRDSIELGLKKVIGFQQLNLTDCQEINQNDQVIIKDTEKQRDKERRRKNFWRFSASVMTGVAIIVSVFGL